MSKISIEKDNLIEMKEREIKILQNEIIKLETHMNVNLLKIEDFDDEW